MRNTTQAQLEKVHTSIINREAGGLDLTLIGMAMDTGIVLLNEQGEATKEWQEFYRVEKAKILQSKLDALRTEVGLPVIALSIIYKESE